MTARTPLDRPTFDREIRPHLKLDAAGLLTAIAQEEGSGAVLMVAYQDPEALYRTLSEGRGWYYSRSRQQYWRKGATSGHTQQVVGARLDCDGDAVLLTVRQRGAACHTGEHSCFDAAALPVDGVAQ